MPQTNLIQQYKTANILIKLIVINVAIFLVVRLLGFFTLTDPYELTKWFVLPDTWSEFVLQPWSFITYSFVHYGFFHILINMLWLYWFGQMILNLFSAKRLLTVYLMGAISGGLLFVLAYGLFPVFENARGYLLGASGAVTALMVFIAAYAPNTAIRIFTFNLKIWQVAVFLVLLDLVRLPSSGNAGGLLAHLGGAILGYVYAVQLIRGKDIGLGFERMMDGVANLFKSRKQRPFKKVHRNTKTKSAQGKSMRDQKSDQQKKVDAILDKISKSGYESLSKSEKDFLFRAGKDD
ncbi:rhomboid family protein [Aureitalea marina]|uniref:Rhomboid family intramembrane serine protease n=1 Tax=Aureitalea marina TaxID=930804 RepID=A0A2S7KQ42_9FLAO|nr:rhomboid family intramembrane serine protease [Aureitalea marina]PQB04693.1 rhomboid family intramembrane serine protease [Aureitalea marina]